MRTGGRERNSTAAVAVYRVCWTARCIIYTREDLKALAKGSNGCLASVLADRSFDLGRSTR